MKNRKYSFIKLKELIIHFLHGESRSHIKIRLAVESAEWNKKADALYKSMTINPEYDPFIQAILGSLNIKKSKSRTLGHYEKLLKKSKNYHELLKNLYHDGFEQVGDLLALIEGTTPKRSWKTVFIISTMVGTLLTFLTYLNKKKMVQFATWVIRKLPIAFNWLKNTFSLIRNIPLIGIIYSGIALMLSWYRTFINGTTTTLSKLNRLSFKTLTACLDIASFTLSFLASGAMSIPGALLNVLSSTTDVFQSIFNWVGSRQAMHKLTKKRPLLKDSANWETIAEYERVSSIHQRDLNSFMTKLAEGILKTIAIGIWCFSVPSLMLAVCCLSLFALVTLTARTIILVINETAANALQKTLKGIKTTQQSRLKMTQSSTAHVLGQLKYSATPNTTDNPTKPLTVSTVNHVRKIEARQPSKIESNRASQQPPRKTFHFGT